MSLEQIAYVLVEMEVYSRFLGSAVVSPALMRNPDRDPGRTIPWGGANEVLPL